MTSSTCSGTLSLPPGTYTGSVTLSDPFTSCSTVVSGKQIQIHPKLKASATLGRTCLSKFTYSGSASNGSGPYTYAWTFSGGGSSGVFRGHKFTLWEGGIRVPCIVSWPGRIPQGAVRDQVAISTDWLPTIAHYAGVPLPEERIDGNRMVPQ